MVRWARQEDWSQIIQLLQDHGQAVKGYDYSTADGTAIVDDVEGILGGVVWFFLGHPETHVRHLVANPMSAKRLLTMLITVAHEYGSQSIEGFHDVAHPEYALTMKKLGAQLWGGTRSRWFLPGKTS